jgi:heme/copper-type cytochrome/quinol oxidase subunit 4
MPGGIRGLSLCISHRGKSVVQVAAIEITVNDLMYIGMEKSVQSLESFLNDLKRGFKIILSVLVIIGRLWVPCTIDGVGRSR